MSIAVSANYCPAPGANASTITKLSIAELYDYLLTPALQQRITKEQFTNYLTGRPNQFNSQSNNSNSAFSGMALDDNQVRNLGLTQYKMQRLLFAIATYRFGYKHDGSPASAEEIAQGYIDSRLIVTHKNAPDKQLAEELIYNFIGPRTVQQNGKYIINPQRIQRRPFEEYFPNNVRNGKSIEELIFTRLGELFQVEQNYQSNQDRIQINLVQPAIAEQTTLSISPQIQDLYYNYLDARFKDIISLRDFRDLINGYGYNGFNNLGLNEEQLQKILKTDNSGKQFIESLQISILGYFDYNTLNKNFGQETNQPSLNETTSEAGIVDKLIDGAVEIANSTINFFAPIKTGFSKADDFLRAQHYIELQKILLNYPPEEDLRFAIAKQFTGQDLKRNKERFGFNQATGSYTISTKQIIYHPFTQGKLNLNSIEAYILRNYLDFNLTD